MRLGIPNWDSCDSKSDVQGIGVSSVGVQVLPALQYALPRTVAISVSLINLAVAHRTGPMFVGLLVLFSPTHWERRAHTSR